MPKQEPEYEIANILWHSRDSISAEELIAYACKEYGYDIATLNRQKIDTYIEEIAWREAWA